MIDTILPTLVIDSVAATPISPGSYITNTDATTIVFTATDTGGATTGVVTECSTDSGASWQVCTSPYTLPLTEGENILKIRARDGVGNLSPVETIIVQKDTESPVLTLNGTDPMEIHQGTPFVDPGATCTDNTSNPPCTVEVSGVVDHTTLGTYALTYTARDGAGNTTTQTRTIKVVPLPPQTQPSTPTS